MIGVFNLYALAERLKVQGAEGYAAVQLNYIMLYLQISLFLMVSFSLGTHTMEIHDTEMAYIRYMMKVVKDLNPKSQTNHQRDKPALPITYLD